MRANSRQAGLNLCESSGDEQLHFGHELPLIWSYAELAVKYGGGLHWLGQRLMQISSDA
jgi:hypothetical protein